MIDEYASEACRYVAGNQEGGVMAQQQIGRILTVKEVTLDNGR